MLFVHDVHAVMGERELEFEDALRSEYAARVADDDTRLLWYLNSTHGAGEAYKVVTITAVRDGAAWERLADRLRRGDLSAWASRAESMRYGCTSTLMAATAWSPLVLDLSQVPTDPLTHDVAVYREDTLEGSGVPTLVGTALGAVSGSAAGDAVLTCVAAFEPALTPGTTVQLLYRVTDQAHWAPAFGLDANWDDWPGSLTPTLPDRVRGSSRILRTTSWSPLP